jgi:hypothetical protein
MAGKYALYLPYKVLDALSNGDVTDSQFREFIMGLAEYDKSGTFPASPTAGFSMMYELLKSDLDFAKAKYEDIIEKRRQAGKKGGAPKGNKNALGNRGGGAPSGNRNAVKDDYPYQTPEPESEKQTQAKQTKQAKQADNSNQISVVSNQYSDKRISSRGSAAPAEGGEVVSSKQPSSQTTTIVDMFLRVCKKVGFSLDKKKATEILNAGIDPAWLDDPFTFPEYVAETIQKNYADKPPEEKRKLFMALLTKEDRIDAFPEWRQNKKAEAAAQKEQRRKKAADQECRRKLDELRKAGPQKCGNCGETIPAPGSSRGTCTSCGFDFLLNEDKGEWEFNKPISLSTEFRRRKRTKKTGPKL